ncbi:MAG: type II toxin-antitoxin system RelE/ParE family toxin [Sphingomonadales bacterium]|nr:type II toxin-antitoxin system RelE/ParE family toxin [Sphingomonadales bacterium]NCO47469.1 type II toxin-antitoxin system RelE/ParE family toxin [Sphingomonadales bacterium]NCP00555.1 type II toxin-antitoxin system RelE/ParE family toxin [Sphingomonadales bacterium]NCP26288.1 type II toxin-antitoxin system RelE/ParE family toxin [Sphingomonadales bacterium]NCP44652.1 type II toxin-antitoxin system RelE/ParE family toxin [Sphingomonadales bacterium]
MNEAELNAIYDLYQSDPAFGKIESRTGGLRKGRVAKQATGKSGGYRVFSFFADAANPVFLLWMIDKTDDDSLTGEQKNAFKAALAKLKKELKK